jgi:hypothetical protein
MVSPRSEIFRETDRDDRFALVARAADGPQAEIGILWLPAFGFHFLQGDRKGHGIRAAVGQLDGESR